MCWHDAFNDTGDVICSGEAKRFCMRRRSFDSRLSAMAGVETGQKLINDLLTCGWVGFQSLKRLTHSICDYQIKILTWSGEFVFTDSSTVMPASAANWSGSMLSDRRRLWSPLGYRMVGCTYSVIFAFSSKCEWKTQ